MSIEVTAVCKGYGQVQALSGVDLIAEAGVVHGLLGPNGAGKTTLMRVLLGLVRPDSGSAQILGEPPAGGRTGVAGFADAPRWWPYLTGRRTLELLARLDGGDAQDRVEQCLVAVDLQSHAQQRVSAWSTGMRQRLGLAAALLRRPKVLVLDEPTSGLDPAGVQDVHALLRDLAAGGTTVLISSHDMAEVSALCTDLTVLAGGRVRFSGQMAALRASLPPSEHLLRTSDDHRAEQVARGLTGVTLTRTDDGLRAQAASLDELVLTLGRDGVAIRSLVEDGDPLTRAFLELTA